MVPRAVHGFQDILLLIYGEDVHVLAVELIVARGVKKLAPDQVRGHNEPISPPDVLIFPEPFDNLSQGGPLGSQ